MLISTSEHEELIITLKLLKQQVEKMGKLSSDPLLEWHKSEVNDWLEFLVAHTDIEELQTLEQEVANRFFEKYNVRIEPRELDNTRLETFEKLLHQFHTVLHAAR